MQFKNTKFRAVFSALALALVLCLPSPTRAALTEPNGQVIPGPPNTPSETTLQSYFDAQAENIDPLNEASTQPGTFSPLCDFEATLVLSQSNAQAGIGWYNVPANPTAVPAAVYPIIAQGTPVNQPVTSAVIRGNPNYTGGLVGFVLTRDGANTYYSEYLRNANCTMCSMPGHWIAALMYRSTVIPSTYYVAFEDWPGANAYPDSWNNDGDFNDKVFRITGISCPGGGVACDTGLPGLCGPGVTECQTGGTIVCKQQVQASDEVCDGLDNDCDGTVDQGELCPVDEVCDKGRCVKNCGEVAFTCTEDQVCSAAGFCVEAACADVACPPGQVCRAGLCSGPCDGVSCPLGQTCLAGRCADPCVGVSCDPGRVCAGGVCVLACDCAGCDNGQTCAPSGQCVDIGCEDQTCAAGTACRDGSCIDACTGAMCPTGQKCAAGQCVDACTDVTCPAGQKCLAGSCADSCSNVSCPPGFKCVPGDDNQGTCVDGCTGVDCGPGKTCMNGSCGSDCVGVVCPTDEVCMAGSCSNPCMTLNCTPEEICRGGACVDRCEGITCPAGQICDAGICITPATGSGGTGAGTGGSVSASGTAGAYTVVGSDGGSSTARFDPNASEGGCGCRVRPGRNSWAALAAAALLGIALLRRKARA